MSAKVKILASEARPAVSSPRVVGPEVVRMDFNPGGTLEEAVLRWTPVIGHDAVAVFRRVDDHHFQCRQFRKSPGSEYFTEVDPSKPWQGEKT